jgi:putative flippase GtrA
MLKDFKIKQFLNRQIFRFILTGTGATVLDFIVYRAILWITDLLSLSKLMGLFAGLMFAYFVNKGWTFRVGKTTVRSLSKFILLYTFSIILNIVINKCILYFIGKDQELFILFAFCVAALASATVNYTGMKFLVFTEGAVAYDGTTQ